MNSTHLHAAVGSEQYYALTTNPPPHPSSTRSPMPQHYLLRDQRRIERVPRPPHFSPPQESIPGITFSVNGWAGVRAKDILKGTTTIDEGFDEVFAHHRWRSIVVHLEWPGYDIRSNSNPMNTRIDVCPEGRHMTRQDLAKEICWFLFNFHKTASRHAIVPGCEKWTLTAGSEGIRVPDIVLFSLHYYRNVWIPELYVIE